jgi:hypothetical protein
MFNFDREKFLDSCRSLGPLSRDLGGAFDFLLGCIEKDDRFPGTDIDRRELAYCLATFWWETAHTMRPIDEHGSDSYFDNRYGPQTGKGQELGNTQPGDGHRFHGRGYVQLTGRNNYGRAGSKLRVDLVANPDQAKEPSLAYQIAIEGMRDGWFTGRKLSQFIRDGANPDYENARTIINDHDNASSIAQLARHFEDALLAASSGIAAPAPPPVVRPSSTVPNGLSEVVNQFGDPRPLVNEKEKWETQALAVVPLTKPLIYAGDPSQPITRVRAHKLLVQHLAETLMACLDAGVPRERLKYGGCYSWRTKRGSSAPSLHTWGIAVDLETAENPLGERWVDDGRRLDPRIIKTFKANSWFWGGDFHGRPDPQHFQWATGV